MRKGQERQHRLVLVPCPFEGHINPMLQLGTILHGKGFSITIAHTKFNFPNPSNHPDFHFLSMSDGLSDGEVVSSMNFIEAISSFNANCKLPFHESLLQMIKHHGDIVCIIYDGLMYFAEEVANHLKLPTIILRTSSAANAVTHNAIPQLLKNGQIPIQDPRLLLETIPELYPLRFKDLPISNFDKVEAILQLIAKGSDARSSSAIIWNTIDFLESTSLKQLQQHYQVPFFPIGPSHKMAPATTNSFLEEDYGCMEWLDKQSNDSVIYVSLGSIVSLNEEELAEMAWGLANSKQPFLWVVRPKTTGGIQCYNSLPESFKEAVGERGCIVKWAPQKDVLAHRAVGGFWSHCGWNSTIESICEGVPMICQPYFGDQKVHARYLSQVWRVGFDWEDDLEREKIEKSVKRLMVDVEGKEMRQRAMNLKDRVELCTRKDGSSHNSLDHLADYILSL